MWLPPSEPLFLCRHLLSECQLLPAHVAPPLLGSLSPPTRRPSSFSLWSALTVSHQAKTETEWGTTLSEIITAFNPAVSAGYFRITQTHTRTHMHTHTPAIFFPTLLSDQENSFFLFSTSLYFQKNIFKGTDKQWSFVNKSLKSFNISFSSRQHEQMPYFAL